MSEHHGLRPAIAEQALRERRELEEQEKDFARARMKRRQAERREQHDAVAELRAEFEREIVALRAELHTAYECQLEATGQALGRLQDELAGHVEAKLKQIAGEFAGEFTGIARTIGEITGRLDALIAGVEPRRDKGFRFANEDAEVLPNPLRPRRDN